MTEKRNIHALIEKEAPSLNNLLDPEDVKSFKAMTSELRDTSTKKQVYRTETEIGIELSYRTVPFNTTPHTYTYLHTHVCT